MKNIQVISLRNRINLKRTFVAFEPNIRRYFANSAFPVTCHWVGLGSLSLLLFVLTRFSRQNMRLTDVSFPTWVGLGALLLLGVGCLIGVAYVGHRKRPPLTS